jgi:hypothetical protein
MAKRGTTRLTLLRRTVEEMVSVVGKTIADRRTDPGYKNKNAGTIAVFGGKLAVCYQLKYEIDCLQRGGMTKISDETRNRLRQLINSRDLHYRPGYMLFSEDRKKLLAFL